MKFKLLSLILIINLGWLQSQTTLIPDPNFEQRLIDMNYDLPPIDGEVETDSINGIIQLWVPNSNISDLTGIQDFAALEVLDVTGNAITSLDMSGNPNLRSLFLETSPVTTLNVTANPLLEILATGHSLISTLDVSNNPALTELRCQNAQLTQLDVSNNPNLSILHCYSNFINELDLSTNTAITQILAYDNGMCRLDVKNGNNLNTTTFNATLNSTSLCIQVDDETAANSGTGAYGSWNKDAAASYMNVCAFLPEMDISGNGMSISSGDNTPDINDDTDFGTINFGDFVDRTFTITNSGAGGLNLSGTPIVSISGSTDFTMTSAPTTTVSASGGTTTFTLRYEPSMAGTINVATISIENNDCDETIYSYDVRGESSTTLGIDEVENDEIFIYPNPSRGKIFIGNLKDTITKMVIYDLHGKEILTINNIESNPDQIDLSYFKGVYFLGLHTNNVQIIKKLVIH